MKKNTNKIKIFFLIFDTNILRKSFYLIPIMYLYTIFGWMNLAENSFMNEKRVI